MHLAKGLEFRAVAVMACDDEIIPLQSRIETATEDSGLEEVYNTEQHLLYVACTCARDQLLVTSAEQASEFLDDFRQGMSARNRWYTRAAGHWPCKPLVGAALRLPA